MHLYWFISAHGSLQPHKSFTCEHTGGLVRLIKVKITTSSIEAARKLSLDENNSNDVSLY